jgi:hypothetical protein
MTVTRRGPFRFYRPAGHDTALHLHVPFEETLLLSAFMAVIFGVK